MSVTSRVPAEKERRLMTAEEFDVLPENDGVDRWIVRGRLCERPATPHGFPRSRTEAIVVHALAGWSRQQPARPGSVVGGEVRFRWRREPLTIEGIEGACIAAEQVAATPPDALFIEGPPLLVVEILSPSDQSDEVTDKIEGCPDAGGSLVGRVEPKLRLITVFRPDMPPKSFSPGDELTAEPHLPGFRVAVPEVFA